MKRVPLAACPPVPESLDARHWHPADGLTDQGRRFGEFDPGFSKAGQTVFTKTLVADPTPVLDAPTHVAAAAPTEPSRAPARVVAGYTLHERLGGGGYGEVWRGTGPGGLSKAVKILHGRLDGPHADAELRALERLRDVRHPFLLNIERIEVDDARVVIITELAEQSLEERFEEHHRAGLRGVPRDELLAYLRDAADALDFMRDRHGLQHLDVKPGNLLIQSGHVKVGDFGLIKDISRTEVSVVGGFTPLYAPPELFEGKPHANSDQYSLAMVYQAMLTGTPPFAGRTAAQLAAQHLSSPPDLAPLPACDRSAVSRALSKNPRLRFKTCREFVDELASGTSGRGQRLSDEPRHPGNRDLPRGGDTEQCVPTAQGPAKPAPARPLPPVQLPDRVAHRPTLFIGLGGFGGQVLLRTRQHLVARSAESRSVAFLYADTDTRAVSVARAEGQLAGDHADAIEIPLRTAAEYRRMSGRYLDWMSRRWLFNIPKSGDVEGIRPLGRLAFVDHHERLRDRLRRLLAALADGTPAENRTPDVVLIASISGGTGGGALLDAGYLARGVLKDLGLEGGRVTALLGYAPPSDPRPRDPARANALAFLKELSRYDEPHGGYPGDAACRLPKSPGLPFDDAWLVCPDAGSPHETDPIDAAAEYLYRSTATPARGFFEACRGAARRTDGEAFTLRTFAVAIDPPSHEEPAGNPHSPGGPAERHAAARSAERSQALLKELGLTSGQIVARITAWLNGDLPRGVQEAARASIADAATFTDAFRAVDRTLARPDDLSRRPEALRRVEAEAAAWIDRSRTVLADRLRGPAAAAGAADVAAGLADVERQLAALVAEIDRERTEVERLVGASAGTAPKATPAGLQKVAGQYAMLRLCEVVYRLLSRQVTDLRNSVERLGTAGTHRSQAPPDLSLEAPEPGLTNVGGGYRLLVAGPAPAATPAGAGSSPTYLCDPDNPPFRCREIEGIRVADAFAALAAADDWAIDAATRLHTRVDVVWGG